MCLLQLLTVIYFIIRSYQWDFGKIEIKNFNSKSVNAFFLGEYTVLIGDETAALLKSETLGTPISTLPLGLSDQTVLSVQEYSQSVYIISQKEENILVSQILIDQDTISIQEFDVFQTQNTFMKGDLFYFNPTKKQYYFSSIESQKLFVFEKKSLKEIPIGLSVNKIKCKVLENYFTACIYLRQTTTKKVANLLYSPDITTTAKLYQYSIGEVYFWSLQSETFFYPSIEYLGYSKFMVTFMGDQLYYNVYSFSTGEIETETVIQSNGIGIACGKSESTMDIKGVGELILFSCLKDGKTFSSYQISSFDLSKNEKEAQFGITQPMEVSSFDLVPQSSSTFVIFTADTAKTVTAFPIHIDAYPFPKIFINYGRTYTFKVSDFFGGRNSPYISKFGGLSSWKFEFEPSEAIAEGIAKIVTDATPEEGNLYPFDTIFTIETLHKWDNSEGTTFVLKVYYGSYPIGRSLFLSYSPIKECYSSCATCAVLGDENDHKCRDCKTGFFKASGTNNCYNKYLGKEGSDFINCKSIGKYKPPNSENCVDTIPKGTFLYNSKYNLLSSCESSCNTCSQSGISSIKNCGPSCTGAEGLYNNQCIDCAANELDLTTTAGGNICISTKEETEVTEKPPAKDPTEEPNPEQEKDSEKDSEKDPEKNPTEEPGEEPKVIKEELPKNIKELFERLEEFISDEENIIIGKGYKLEIIKTNKEQKEKEDISSIDLGVCEKKLKDVYQIPEGEELIIVKLDIERGNELTPQVEYKVYDKNLKELSLSVCSGDEIEISCPINFNATNINYEEAKKFAALGYDIYNQSDVFFNDICERYVSDVGDMVIKDRRLEVFTNVSFCEETCEYNGIDINLNKVKCLCNIKEDISTSIAKNKNPPFFTQLLDSTNLVIVKCYRTLGVLKNYKNNLGFFFISVILIIEILLFIFFVASGYESILIEIAKIGESLSPLGNYKRAHTSTDLENATQNVIVAAYNFQEECKGQSLNGVKIFWNLFTSKNELLEIIFYRSPYKKLGLCFSFYIFAIAVDFTFNSILFSDDIISKKYHNEGNLTFLTSVLLSIASNILGNIFGLICNKLLNFQVALESLQEDLKNKKNFGHILPDILYYLKRNLTVYFTLQFLLLLMFWYYLTIFCNVFRGSQVNWFVDCITGVGMSLAYSFGMSLLIALLKTLSLNCRLRTPYKISLYLENVL